MHNVAVPWRPKRLAGIAEQMNRPFPTVIWEIWWQIQIGALISFSLTFPDRLQISSDTIIIIGPKSFIHKGYEGMRESV